MNIKPQIKYYLFLPLSLLTLFSLAFVGGYFIYGKFITHKEAQVDNSPAKTPTSYFGETQKDQSLKNILLLGYGGAGHSGGTLADSIIVLSINTKTKKASIISIPRDIWINLPTDWENLRPGKINEAYAIGLDDTKYPNKKPEFKGPLGGGNMVKYAVSQVTGMPIDYFVSVSFDQYVQLINSLGGIEVNVSNSFTDEFYPIKGMENDLCGKNEDEVNTLKAQYSDFALEKNFTCRYEVLTFEKGPTKMDGETALKYVRSRHSAQDGGDFARSQRQISVLIAIKDRLLSLEAIGNIDKIYPPLSKLVTSDLNLATIKTLIDFFGDPKSYSVDEINLSTKNDMLSESKSPGGAYILLPKAGFGNWDETQKYIKNHLIPHPL